MSETLYIETSILGHLTARPTENLILAANIKITQDCWDEYSSSLVLYVSEKDLTAPKLTAFKNLFKKTKNNY